MNLEAKTISLVIPLHNEEQVLMMSFEAMNSVMASFGCKYEIIYIDDGSRDATWSIVEQLCKKDKHVIGLKLSRNFGHQNAVTAGMAHSKGDAVIIIDADLQDPPAVMIEMLEKWLEGNHVVYGKRLKREGEKFLKKFTASIYYRALSLFAAYPIPLDTGDFRLLDRCVVDTMNNMKEHNRFLRGMSAWAGYKQCPVEYIRHERAAGSTNYTFKKMLKLAGDGILGFSSLPLMLPLYFGAFSLFGCFIALIIQAIMGTNPIYMLFTITFALISLVMIFIGIQGLYLARMNDETSNRPNYIISEIINNSTV